jgi:hypothetical protein
MQKLGFDLGHLIINLLAARHGVDITRVSDESTSTLILGVSHHCLLSG